MFSREDRILQNKLVHPNVGIFISDVVRRMLFFTTRARTYTHTHDTVDLHVYTQTYKDEKKKVLVQAQREVDLEVPYLEIFFESRHNWWDMPISDTTDTFCAVNKEQREQKATTHTQFVCAYDTIISRA